MDVFYEESAIAQDAKRQERIYKRIHLFSNILLVIGFLLTILGCGVLIDMRRVIIWILTCCSWFFVGWFLLFKWKQLYDVNYDYVFVSGEIRISKVIHTSKRRLVVRLQPEDILQVGDVDNAAFKEFQKDSSIKTVYCTSNDTPMEGKFFMYLLVSDNGKKLYVLECREELLINMMKFLKRTTLENDYVPQEKKKKV